MKFILFTSLLVTFSPWLLRAEQLRQAPIAEIIVQAVPTLSYVSGDKNWSGGYNTNAYVAATEFDTNTSFTVLRASDASLSAIEIAKRVRDFIAKRFDFPTNQPFAVWQKRLPNGFSEADFGEAFLQTSPTQDTPEKQRCYLTVQVVRRSPTDFAVTIQYSTVAQQ